MEKSQQFTHVNEQPNSNGIIVSKELVDLVYKQAKLQELEVTNRTHCVRAVISCVLKQLVTNGYKDFRQLKVYFPVSPAKDNTWVYADANFRAQLEKNGTIVNLGRFIDGMLYFWLTGDWTKHIAPRLVYPKYMPKPFIAPETVSTTEVELVEDDLGL